MRRTTLIAGVAGAAIVLGGGVALANGGGSTPPGGTGRAAAVAPSASPSTPAAPKAPVTPRAPGAIDSGEAARIALRVVPGGWIESVELETEHGRTVWDVDVIVNGVEHDIHIDVRTGTVLRHRTDDDRGRGRDDRGHDDRGHDDRGHGRGHDDRGRHHGGHHD
ncbi:PepSY domain-containing protein, partial [Actinomadura sp.]|uniref:PepSY domain-containing protein n=2 Tax=Actinomadura sp. TaxID=1989 RepID=UPI0037C5ED77